MKESEIQNRIRNALVDECLMFRVNVGQAWTGDQIEHLPNRAVIITNARPFSTGLPPGFSDLFGLVPVTITPDMVGKTFGLFTAIEVKTSTGKASGPQGRFLGAIDLRGGKSGIARSVEDAVDLIKQAKQHGGGS